MILTWRNIQECPRNTDTWCGDRKDLTILIADILKSSTHTKD